MWSEKVKVLAEEQSAKGELPAFGFPGGYPIYYVDDSQMFLCAKCANADKDSRHVIVDYAINWSDSSLLCEECNNPIESAYDDPFDNKSEVEWEDLHPE